MSDTPEVKLKKKLKALYKEYGALLVQPIGTVFTQAGVHDHILCVRGLFISVEVKAGKGKMTPAQMEFGRMVRRSGGFAVCVNENGFDAFADLLHSLQAPVQSQVWRAALVIIKQATDNTFPYEEDED